MVNSSIAFLFRFLNLCHLEELASVYVPDHGKQQRIKRFTDGIQFVSPRFHKQVLHDVAGILLIFYF